MNQTLLKVKVNSKFDHFTVVYHFYRSSFMEIKCYENSLYTGGENALNDAKILFQIQLINNSNSQRPLCSDYSLFIQ